jgi:hypothetical protein
MCVKASRRQAWKTLLEQESERLRDRYGGWAAYERGAPRAARNGWPSSATPSSSASTWNGKPAPSAFLHKRLDVIVTDFFLTFTQPGVA